MLLSHMVDWCTERPSTCSIPAEYLPWRNTAKKDKIVALSLLENSWLVAEYNNFKQFMMKVPADRLLVVSYEKLVGSRGGGSDLEELEEICRIAETS